MIVNGTDLATIGFNDAPPAPDHWHTVRRQHQTKHVPGRAGVTEIGDPIVGSRVIVIRGFLSRSTHALWLDALDEIKFRLTQPGTPLAFFNDQDAVQITLPDMDPGGANERIFLAKAVAVRPKLKDPSMIGAGVKECELAIEVLLLYPYMIDMTATSVTGITTIFTDIDQGSAPALGVFKVDGIAAQPFSIQYRNHATTVLHSMTFDRALAAGESYTVDMSAATVVGAGGAPAASLPFLSAGDFFSMDPRDGDGTFPVDVNPPEVNVTAGTLRVDYYKAWR